MSIVKQAPGRAAAGPIAAELRRRPSFRADIQALRALAVSLVVLNHLWPKELSGGYVGVDVFFVISGFLITSHLLRELLGTGRIRLASFYARRIRRLLPAAFLVLTASLIAAMVWLPFSRWEDTAHEVLASALYTENWVLAAKSVDYSASTSSATVVQHFWSLSVEEQFYLIWPLLLLALSWLAGRGSRPGVPMVFGGIAAVTALGLAASVLTTEYSPNQAYFVTPVRAWEFGAGALTALALGRQGLPSPALKGSGPAGFTLIVCSALAFNDGTAFPGFLALLPVLGTVMVIVAGNNNRRPAFKPLISLIPLQYLGNISYSLYLWHWPLIVIAPFALGHALDNFDRIGIVLLAVVLAGLTKAYVEDRGQLSVYLTASARRTFVAMAVGMALVAGLAGLQLHVKEIRQEAAEQAAAAAALEPCHGPLALLPGADCADPFGPSAAPVMSDANDYWKTPPSCDHQDDELKAADTRTHQRCDFSGGRRDAKTVWLVGDSHAQQWQAAVFAAAKQRGWIVRTALLGGCPVADVEFTGYEDSADQNSARTCMDWAKRVTDAVAADRPAAVFTSMFARRQSVDDGSGRPVSEQFTTGLQRTWQRWTDAGSMVYVLADPPLNQAVRQPDCTNLHIHDPASCAVDRAVAQPEDPLITAAKSSYNRDVQLVDLTDYFCDQRKCYTVVGGVNVYFDANHLNREYSELLAPLLLDRLAK
ncbi:peptidoglycan/LPS O-acetylase OafA/YrhL [Arthrobacter globiformis]|uniref:acyltransferase family protein n=1 Tax=Arthrobacter globiformis TaxID=1665 RepID=UPI00278BA8DC|nr:acyltransferase family protein [Arthrobacter globiformis]MDQ1059762.1 peptidoglycan/LPS O-acetylase OafA/YrhL [Arthrobacter globiformis]